MPFTSLPIATTPEGRLADIHHEMGVFATDHDDRLFRSFYADSLALAEQPSSPFAKALGMIATNGVGIGAVDVANSLPRQLLAQEMLGPDPDPNDPNLLHFDSSILVGRERRFGWRKPLDILEDPREFDRFVGGCLLPTQSNPAGRGRWLKFVSLLYGITEPTVAEFGTSAGLILKQAALGQEDFPYRDVEVGHRIRVEEGFAPNFLMTKLVNRMVHHEDYRIDSATGYDFLLPRSPIDLARVKVYTLYGQHYFDGVTEPELQALFDAPRPENVNLKDADLSIDPEQFAAEHADELGSYAIVYLPTMLYQSKAQPEAAANILRNADQLRLRDGGLIVVQDYVQFRPGPAIEGSRHRPRNQLDIFSSWPLYSYSLWVDSNAGQPDRRHLDFTLLARSASGRANRWWLEKNTAKRVVASSFAGSEG